MNTEQIKKIKDFWELDKEFQKNMGKWKISFTFWIIFFVGGSIGFLTEFRPLFYAGLILEIGALGFMFYFNFKNGKILKQMKVLI